MRPADKQNVLSWESKVCVRWFSTWKWRRETVRVLIFEEWSGGNHWQWLSIRYSTNNEDTNQQMPRHTIPLGYVSNNSPRCPFSLPQVLLQFPPEGGSDCFEGEGLKCPWLCPPSNPQSPLRSLFGPPPSPPWGRWQPSTVKGRGSHDGFHRWSVEIAGKDLGSVAQQRTRGSQREIWVRKERDGETKRRARRRCLFKEGGVPKVQRLCSLGRMRSLRMFAGKSLTLPPLQTF